MSRTLHSVVFTLFCFLLVTISLGCGPQNKPAAGDNPATGGDGAPAAGSDAIEAYTDPKEAVKDATEIFTKMTEALARIKDVETAEQSMANIELAQLGAELIKLAVAKSSSEIKTAVAGTIDPGIAQVEQAAAKLEGLHGVKAIVQPKIDALLATVKSWKS